ncbi:hypothetical protein PGDDIFCJ_00099 [Thermus phage YS40_Isch]|nr:hypothetical protein PGDDIFCJ_00099 [Thermus phage YS40_Isch]
MQTELVLLDRSFDLEEVRSMIYEAVEKILEQNKDLLFLRKPKFFSRSILFQLKERRLDSSFSHLEAVNKPFFYLRKTFDMFPNKEDLESGLEDFLDLLFESMYSNYVNDDEKRYLINSTKPFLMKIKTAQQKFYNPITRSYQTIESKNIFFYPAKEEDFAKEKEIYFPLISKVSLSKKTESIVVSRSYICVLFEIEENF